MPTDSGPIARALADSLKDAQVEARDRAGVALARRLAQLLDAARGTKGEADVFADLAPKYLTTLTALGLTPAGRGKGGTSGGTASTALDELRARRQQRSG